MPYITYTHIGLNNSVFPKCRRIMGLWHSYYGNCKWPDHAAQCHWGGDDTSSDSDGDISTGGRGGRSGRSGRGGSSGGGRMKGGRLI